MLVMLLNVGNAGNVGNVGKGVKHYCASILDSIAKGTSCSHYFSHGASLHRHSFR